MMMMMMIQGTMTLTGPSRPFLGAGGGGGGVKGFEQA